MSSISAPVAGEAGARPVAQAALAGERLAGLQALRGLGAVLVMLLHAAQMAGLFERADPLSVAVSRLSTMGYFGVDIFFVLSGVVISILLRRNAAKPEAPGGFLARRAAKLLPTFWVTLGLLVLLPAAPDSNNGVGALLAEPLSLVLLTGQPVHPLGWTLVYEAHFYIIAALALCFGTRAHLVMLCWVPLHVAAVCLIWAGLMPKLPLVTPQSLELCAGLVIGSLALRWPMPAPGAIAVGVLAGVAAMATTLPIYGLTMDAAMRLLLLGVPAMLLVYAALSLDAAGWTPPRVALWLGEISYSLYMWHLVALIALATFAFTWRESLPGAFAYWGLGIALSIVVARAAHQFIEAPPSRLANRLTRGRRA